MSVIDKPIGEVTLRVRVWIEIIMLNLHAMDYKVTLRVRVWIEITSTFTMRR